MRSSRGECRLVALLSALLMAGCSDEGERPLASETLLGLEADQVLVDVEMTLTRAGVRRGLLVADTAFSFHEGRLMLRNLRITFFNETGAEQGALRGLEGEYWFETGDVRVDGDVEVVESTGSKRLVTHRLRYEALPDSLYGDTTFVLYRPGLEMHGDSFMSDAELENVESMNPSIVSDGPSPAVRENPR